MEGVVFWHWKYIWEQNQVEFVNLLVEAVQLKMPTSIHTKMTMSAFSHELS
jgi:hypothetical protein